MGCNKFNESFHLTGVNNIQFSPLAITNVTCAEDKVESEFIGAMSNINNWSIVNNQLLLSNGKIVLMKLKAATTQYPISGTHGN